MAKVPNFGMLLLPIAIFAFGLSSTFSGVAFADDQDGQYSHSHITALWKRGLVCGDHKCAPGETPQIPPGIQPVKGAYEMSGQQAMGLVKQSYNLPSLWICYRCNLTFREEHSVSLHNEPTKHSFRKMEYS